MSSSCPLQTSPEIPRRDPNRVLGHEISKLTSTHAFRWTSIDNDIFQYWLNEYDTSPNLNNLNLEDILIEQLGFHIYYGKTTEKGDQVIDILTKKVMNKIRTTRQTLSVKSIAPRRSERLNPFTTSKPQSVCPANPASPVDSVVNPVNFQINNQVPSQVRRTSSLTSDSQNLSTRSPIIVGQFAGSASPTIQINNRQVDHLEVNSQVNPQSVTLSSPSLSPLDNKKKTSEQVNSKTKSDKNEGFLGLFSARPANEKGPLESLFLGSETGSTTATTRSSLSLHNLSKLEGEERKARRAEIDAKRQEEQEVEEKERQINEGRIREALLKQQNDALQARLAQRVQESRGAENDRLEVQSNSHHQVQNQIQNNVELGVENLYGRRNAVVSVRSDRREYRPGGVHERTISGENELEEYKRRQVEENSGREEQGGSHHQAQQETPKVSLHQTQQEAQKNSNYQALQEITWQGNSQPIQTNSIQLPQPQPPLQIQLRDPQTQIQARETSRDTHWSQRLEYQELNHPHPHPINKPNSPPTTTTFPNPNPNSNPPPITTSYSYSNPNQGNQSTVETISDDHQHDSNWYQDLIRQDQNKTPTPRNVHASAYTRTSEGLPVRPHASNQFQAPTRIQNEESNPLFQNAPSSTKHPSTQHPPTQNASTQHHSTHLSNPALIDHLPPSSYSHPHPQLVSIIPQAQPHQGKENNNHQIIKLLEDIWKPQSQPQSQPQASFPSRMTDLLSTQPQPQPQQENENKNHQIIKLLEDIWECEREGMMKIWEGRKRILRDWAEENGG